MISQKGKRRYNHKFEFLGSDQPDKVILDINNCQGTECFFVTDQSYRISIGFQASENNKQQNILDQINTAFPLFRKGDDSETLSVSAYWYQFGVPVLLESVPEDGCLEMKPPCPIRQDRQTEYSVQIKISSAAPVVNTGNPYPTSFPQKSIYLILISILYRLVWLGFNSLYTSLKNQQH